VVTAVGYRAVSIPGVPTDTARGLIINVDGRVDDGLYVVGWAKRGPTGVIGTNKPDGMHCARQICAEVPTGGRLGRVAFERKLIERGVRFVSFADWLAIDAAEVASAAGPAPRHKLSSIEEMLAVLNRSTASTAAAPRQQG
jgi:ferredoxin--NADP+ reductase